MTTIANAFFKVLGFFDQRKWAVLLLGVILGLVLGLIYMRYYVDSLEWDSAGPAHLRSDFQNEYLVWVARNYESQSQAEPEWARHKLLGVDYKDRKPADVKHDAEKVAKALDNLAQGCEAGTAAFVGCSADDATRLRNLSADMKNVAEAAKSPSSPLGTILPYCLGIVLVLVVVGGGGFLAYRWWRGRQEEQEVREGIAERVRPIQTVAWAGEGPPLAQFPTTYVLGDDHFDPSFSVEMENGEFMGECGVGVSETIGVGAPSKVTAFEVWLFDKSDIRTVTKVVMSDYAFNDEALRTKLAPKGEPMQAKEGAEIVLETKTLRIKAHIVEVGYGVGNLPPNSFFDRLSIDLAAWVKQAPEGAPMLEEGSLDMSFEV
jgi:hypothetical protein